MGIQRPMCQFRGAAPHPAKPAYILVWKLPSGDVTRFSCADHRFGFGGKGYWINKVEGFLQDTDASEDRTQKESAAAATVRPRKNETSTAPTESTCIRCCNALALPYPLGCGGQLCQRCVDLQNAEYRQWVAKQRALGNISFGSGEPETRLVR
jgi:hypothetical protein